MAAKRSKKSSAQGGGIGVVVIGIGYAIYNFIVEHKTQAILVAAAVVGLIVLLIIAKKIRIKRYWNWYFSRDRGLADISSQEYRLEEETAAALSRTARRITGCQSANYTYLKDALNQAYQSDEILVLENNTSKGKYTSDGFSSSTLLNSINVTTDGEAIGVYCKVNEDGGYHFIILPNIIYAFITGGRRYSFVAAYDQKMLKVDLDHINYRKEYHHITDMSHQPRSYFLKYCDVKDSKAVAAGWQYETKNGYRDGRRQGNNFFIVKFSYTTVNYSWGKLQTTTAFSCTAVYALIWDAFKVYKEMDRSSSTVPLLTEEKVEDKCDSSEKIASDNGRTPTSEAKTDTYEEAVSERIELKPISCDEARAKNRAAAKVMQDEMNSLYGSDPEFKVFQVRKERDNWKLQDSEIYAYFEKDGVRVCIEFIFRTALENGITKLEYKLSADDESVLKSHYQRIFDKYKMVQNGSSYSVVFDNDFQDWDHETLLSRLVPRLKEFTDEAMKAS